MGAGSVPSCQEIIQNTKIPYNFKVNKNKQDLMNLDIAFSNYVEL